MDRVEEVEVDFGWGFNWEQGVLVLVGVLVSEEHKGLPVAIVIVLSLLDEVIKVLHQQKGIKLCKLQSSLEFPKFNYFLLMWGGLLWAQRS